MHVAEQSLHLMAQCGDEQVLATLTTLLDAGGVERMIAFAAHHGYELLLDTLLRAPQDYDINAQSTEFFGRPPALVAAVMGAQPRCVSRLLDYGASHASVDAYQRDALQQALWYLYCATNYTRDWERIGNHGRSVRVLIDHIRGKGMLVNCYYHHGWNRLMVMSSLPGSSSVVRLLLRKDLGDADPNMGSTSGTTPLMLAAHTGDCVLVQDLLDAGADVHPVDRYGRTAHDIAASRFADDVVALLKQYGSPGW